MQHLTDEELARIADEDPTAAEAAHLAACAECTSELRATREQIVMLAELPDLAPPPHLERRLRAGLAAEGLALSTRARRLSALRIAASVALFAAGGLAGFLGRGAVTPAQWVAALAHLIKHRMPSERAFPIILAAIELLRALGAEERADGLARQIMPSADALAIAKPKDRP